MLRPTALQRAAVEAARAYRAAHGARILADFAAFLSIPNVASDLTSLQRNADYLVGAFGRRGLRTEVLYVPGAPPTLYGVYKTPGATRTLGLYAHYDGQPANEGRWTHPPWEPTLCTAALDDGGHPRPLPATGEPLDPEWRIYARSASDDKAPFAALLAALDALRAAGQAPSVHVKVLFDGEEETSSPHLATCLDRYRETYQDVDLWLLLDGPVHQTRRPLLGFGVRGTTGLEVTVYGAERPLHSGHYGIVRVTPGHELRLQHPLLAKVTRQHGYPAARTAMDLPLVRPVAAAVAAATGQAPLRTPTLGASMPLHQFTGRLGKPALVVPIANHDNNQHAADENLRLANLFYGIDLYAALLTMPAAT